MLGQGIGQHDAPAAARPAVLRPAACSCFCMSAAVVHLDSAVNLHVLCVWFCGIMQAVVGMRCLFGAIDGGACILEKLIISACRLVTLN